MLVPDYAGLVVLNSSLYPLRVETLESTHCTFLVLFMFQALKSSEYLYLPLLR